MRKMNLKQVVLNPVFSSTNWKRNGNTTQNYLIDDNQSILKFVLQLSALMVTLPIITALLLMWFKMK